MKPLPAPRNALARTNFDSAPVALATSTCAAAAVGIGVGRDARVLVVVGALVVAAGLLHVLVTSPKWALRGSLVLLVLIPFSGLPFYGAVHPGAAALAIAALAIVLGIVPLKLGRPTPMDLAPAAVIVGMALSVVVAHQSWRVFVSLVVLWLAPYVVGRAFGASDPRELLRALTIAGAVMLPFALVEAVGPNVFLEAFSYASNEGVGTGVLQERLGLDRAQGALGQSILYAIVLTVCAIATVTVWATQERRSRLASVGLLGLALALIVAQATSLARTGWLILAIVAVAALATAGTRFFNQRNLAIAAAFLAVGAVVLAVPQTRSLLLGSGSASSELQTSADYRSQLLNQASQPGYFAPFGRTTTQVGPDGNPSIDNAYIVVTWNWGYLPTLGLLGMLLVFATQAVRGRRDGPRLVINVVGFALMLVLGTVALFGQFQIILWLIAGASAGTAASAAGRA